jgi:hypothetical protein
MASFRFSARSNALRDFLRSIDRLSPAHTHAEGFVTYGELRWWVSLISAELTRGLC